MNTQPFSQTNQMMELFCEYLSVRSIQLCVLIMWRTRFRVNPHFLNITELLARNKCNIWRLSKCNGTRTHNHLVHKQTPNHFPKLGKWLSCVVSTYMYGALDCVFLSCHLRLSEWMHTLKIPECQGNPWLKQAQYLKFKWRQWDSNT